MLAVVPKLESGSDPFKDAQDEFSEVQSYLTSAKARNMSHSELERELQKRGRELMRRLLQGHLDSRGPGNTNDPVVGADDVERREERDHRRNLNTTFGKVKVERLGYGEAGVDSLHPLDAELNLPAESYSFEVRRCVAEEAAKGSFEEAMKTLRRYTGADVGKHQVEELAVRASRDFDEFYDSRRVGPDVRSSTGSILVVTFDAKGVVMHRNDLREATQAAARRRAQRRAPSFAPRPANDERRDAKRMATVAAIYTVAPFVRTPDEFLVALAPSVRTDAAPPPQRPKPENKRVLASVEKESWEVIEEAILDAEHRDPRHTKTWVALVDGDEIQLDRIEEIRDAYEVPLLIIVDIIHVAQYVWKASRGFHEQGHEREYWVQTRLQRVLQGKAVHVAAGMRRSATLRKLSDERREPVDKCADYLQKYAPSLRYDEYLAAGLPIATGVIEGAVRYLVKDRMELTGARWRLTGAEAVLRLRALRSSGDFDEYWQFHEEREYQRNHAARYKNHKIPRTVQPQERPDLTLIKK